MNTFNSILAIGAHPDDIEFSCLGLLLDQKSKGAKIYSLILSAGENGNNGDGNMRRMEQENAFKMAGFESIEFGTFEDGKIGFDTKTIGFIENIIFKCKPDLILTHHPNDWHQDHVNTALATRAACRNYPKLWYYRSYSVIDFIPVVYVDISKVIEQKKDIIGIFNSQIEKNLLKGIDFKQIAVNINQFLGSEAGVPYAEGFVVCKYLI